MKNQSPDTGIPVLTEIIPSQASAPAAPMTKEREPAPVSQGNAVRDDDSWSRLEQEVRERVLQQVLERIDSILEQRVRDSLADVLQTATEQLAADIRSSLHGGVKEVVTRAVTQEIARLQATKQ